MQGPDSTRVQRTRIIASRDQCAQQDTPQSGEVQVNGMSVKTVGIVEKLKGHVIWVLKSF
jgi:hypothetical protein